VPRTFPLAFAAVLVAAGIATLAPTAAHGVPYATFSPPMLLAGGGAEPSIRVPEDGRSAAYVSAPSGLGSNFWRITEHQNTDGTKNFVQSAVQQPDLGTGGGDSEISVGNDAVEGCDPIAYSGLHNIDLLDNFTVATSADCGKTFALANPYGTQNTLTDRQWQAFDGKKTNFLIYHKVDTSQIVVSESADGGQTYVSLSPDGSHGIIDATTLPAVADSNQVGNIVTDYSQAAGSNNPLSGEPTHVMYATFGGPRDAADNAQAHVDSNAPGPHYNHVDTIYLAKSTDGGLTWIDTKVYGVDPASKRELNMLFPVVDVDQAGNVYVVWADGFKVEYAVSTDHGATFSQPYQVNHDNKGLVPVTGVEAPDPGKADLFPWLAAGANGMLDVVWYHGSGGAPTSNIAYRDPGDKNTAWTVAFAQLGSATHLSGGAAAPTELTYSEAVTPVIHKGDICQNGTFCSLVPIGGTPFSDGDRSLLDFFEVAIDADGRANIALADNVDSPGSLISAYTRQTSGYSLTTGLPLPPQHIVAPRLKCSPDASFTDPKGDATEFVVASPLPNAPALDITKGSVSYDSKTKHLVLHIAVADLSQDPPTGSTGEQFEYGFAYGGTGYFAVANHDATAAKDSFHMESPLRTTVGKPLTGTFDKTANEIRIEIPATWFKDLGKGPVIGNGSKVSGLAITARRSEANRLVPNVDEAGSLGCPFVVSATSSTTTSPGTVPAPVVKRPVPPLATTGSNAGLPLIAAGLAVGALALRRRRVSSPG
jgi:hypothetical protein